MRDLETKQNVHVRILTYAVTLLFVLPLYVGCGMQSRSGSREPRNDVRAKNVSDSNASSILRLASTTSARDSGLFDVLLPVFEEANACRVDLIAVGTGAALKLGEAGDVDAVLCHAPSAEKAFMRAGHGVRHESLMHNFFVVAGPADDPAGVKGNDVIAGLRKIAAGNHRFVSRGDDSGTHKRELTLWEMAGGRPEWSSYIESGQGQGPTNVMADEMNAYVLTDEGTWLKQSGNFQLVPLVTGADELRNPYAVMVVNSEKHPSVNVILANALVDFLISECAQSLIAEYQINGHNLFQPARMPYINGQSD